MSEITADDTLRIATRLAAKAGMEVDEYLDLARLGLRAWRMGRKLPFWRVGTARVVPWRHPEDDGTTFKCVMGEGPTLRSAIEAARPWVPSFGSDWCNRSDGECPLPHPHQSHHRHARPRSCDACSTTSGYAFGAPICQKCGGMS